MVIFLATETEIVILEGNKTSVQHFARQKSLKPKKIEISVPTNGEKFDKITVSKRGQVFLKSQNGQLFELEYKVFNLMRIGQPKPISEHFR
ncbi:hypothetical protein MHBO_002295 [Bonamia ostreae]|uniref:Uncharacterized protein n=1 Tax=Bonamia ostreae TaxID=126728 RepID=A0ABV2ALV5_9EUKA